MAYINFTNLWRTPLIATFDLHGTLLSPTWKLAYERTYLSLIPETTEDQARGWVEHHSPGTDEEALLSKLVRFTGKPAEDISQVLKKHRLDIAKHVPAQAQTGVQDFLDNLRRIGDVQICITTYAKNRAVILKQLIESGLLGKLIDEAQVFTAQGLARTDKNDYRSHFLHDLHIRYPDHRHIFFNNTPDGMLTSSALGDITVGVMTGSEQEAVIRDQMIHSGAHFIIEDWRQAEPLLAINALDEGLHLFTNQPPLPGLSLVGPPIGLRYQP